MLRFDILNLDVQRVRWIRAIADSSESRRGFHDYAAVGFKSFLRAFWANTVTAELTCHPDEVRLLVEAI